MIRIFNEREELFKFLISSLAIIILFYAVYGSRMQEKRLKYEHRKDLLYDQRVNDPYWIHAKKEVYRDMLELIRQNENEIASGIRYNKLFHGSKYMREVALTFDDGPHPAFTPKILDILKRYNVKATFFLVGNVAEQYPNLVTAEVALGNSIGNHSFSHIDLTTIPTVDVGIEIEACRNVLRSITGKNTWLFRPPGGDYNRIIADITEALGYTIVLWTVNSRDYEYPNESEIEKTVLRQAKNGSIIVLHDGIEQTIKALPNIIEALKKKGYRFVTIEEMLRYY